MYIIKSKDQSEICWREYLEAASKLIIPTENNDVKQFEDLGEEDRSVALAFNKNIESLGFTLSQEALYAFGNFVATNSSIDIDEYTSDIIETLKHLVGADVTYTPFYTDFPLYTMQASSLELYFNAIIHYLTMGEYKPAAEYEDRPELTTLVGKKLNVINVACEKDYFDYIRKTYEMAVTINAATLPVVNEMLANMTQEDIKKYLVGITIANKDNMASFVCFVLKTGNENFLPLANTILKDSIKSATDVFRIANALGYVKVNEKDQTKFKYRSFTNKERKFIMSLFEICAARNKNFLSELYADRNQVRKLFHAIHPSNYRKIAPNAVVAVQEFAEESVAKILPRYTAKVEAAFKAQPFSAESLVTLLSKRPGTFARNLDRCLVNATSVNDIDTILEAFAKVASKVSPKVLLDAINAFKSRNASAMRYAVPKTGPSHIISWEETRIPFSEELMQKVITILEDAFKAQLAATHKDIGKVYFNPALKDYVFPTVVRDMQKDIKSYARGTRIPFDSYTDVIRSFIFWDTYRDLDLSILLLDEEGEAANNNGQCCYVDYIRLRDNRGIIHSGDRVDGYIDGGGAEFVDIDIEKALNSGIRYVAMNVNLFIADCSGEMDTCYAGIQERVADTATQHEGEDDRVHDFVETNVVAQNGEVYEPSTVTCKIDMPKRFKSYIPYIIDLKEKIIIIAGVDISRRSCYNELHSNFDVAVANCKAILTMSHLSIQDVIEYNIAARNGELVETPEEADIVFDIDTGIMAHEAENLLAELM